MPTRRPIAALAALLATFALAGAAPAASPTVSPSSPPVVSAPPVGPGAAWPFRGHDVAGTGATSGSGIDAQTVAEKIRVALNQPFEIVGHGEEHRIAVSACIGIAFYPEDGTDMIELSRHADEAMYRAKESGRNAVAFYNLSG